MSFPELNGQKKEINSNAVHDSSLFERLLATSPRLGTTLPVSTAASAGALQPFDLLLERFDPVNWLAWP